MLMDVNPLFSEYLFICILFLSLLSLFPFLLVSGSGLCTSSATLTAFWLLHPGRIPGLGLGVAEARLGGWAKEAVRVDLWSSESEITEKSAALAVTTLHSMLASLGA
uniref:Uncharacterized protein n=1 Tax=Opuntia streptacantha TaxID=393608 RepID=A0A7C9DK12_OPUST